jgi:DNA replication protein DnaC
MAQGGMMILNTCQDAMEIIKECHTELWRTARNLQLITEKLPNKYKHMKQNKPVNHHKPSKEQLSRRLIMYEEKSEEVMEMISKSNKRVAGFLRSNWDKMKPITEQSQSCFIHGEAGTGKTVTAVWMMFEWLRLQFLKGSFHRTAAAFVTVSGLLAELKSNMDSDIKNIDIVQNLLNVDILVLDDIGAIRTTDWSFDILYRIIDSRYSAMKPTIYTSNLTLKEFADLIGDDRITSRIDHDCGESIFEAVTQYRNK